MNHFLAENEIFIRSGFFFGIFIIVTFWEILAPKRALSASKGQRWYSNLSIVLINSLVIRWLFPILALGMAIEAQKRGWGLFNNIRIAGELHWALSIVILDFVIYLQHIIFHASPLLWRLHRMHHTDLDFDVTTGSRFHPIEIIVSMLIKIAVVVALGTPPVAVIIFEVLLNGAAMFNHGNIRVPKKLDALIRWFVVTPDMHRVHHSVILSEINSNFGFNLPWWDRLFGTYQAQPQEGHNNMTIGMNLFRNPKYLHFHWLIIQPFISSDKYEKG